MIKQSIVIESYKHNNKIHRTWAETYVLADTPHIIGVNERCKVTEADQKVWTTKDPAVVMFPKGKWFNIVGMLNPNGYSYYCNIISPINIVGNVLRYVDYDIDIIYDRGNIRVVDEDEFHFHKKIWGYSTEVENHVNTAVTELKQWMKEGKGPFAPAFLDYWYDRYKAAKGE